MRPPFESSQREDADFLVSQIDLARGSGKPLQRFGLDRACKRLFDIVVTAGLLALLSPVLATLAVVVRIDSPGPAFFRCDRVGFRGRRLRMLKFRKMRADATGGPLTTAEDARFTRIGQFLAKYKLDELPQLWHVLIGEMSIVGPRPEDPKFVERKPVEFREEILSVRPGIIGLSQLAFAEESQILDARDPVGHYVERVFPQKVALDRMYAATRSMILDLRILFWAFVAVLFRQPVAVDRATGAMRIRRRPRTDGTHPQS
jgi:lipopolysaccharide/colanic/teichoic acid biosynthesis glycosyltransferase